MKAFNKYKFSWTGRYFALLLCLSLLTGLSGCGEAGGKDPQAEEKEQRYVSSMDTVMVLTAYGSHRQEALAAAEEEILRLNDLFSIGVESSEVATANREGSAVLSGETAEVLQGALEVYELTGGLFDITVTPLMELWGFTTGNYYVPTAEEVAAQRARMGVEGIRYDSATGVLTLPEDCRIDLGGIAKGYTSQRVMEVFAQCGVSSGIISLGGNVQCLGTKPDGSLWNVVVRQPGGSESAYAAVLRVSDCAVITSGGYERYFEDEETGEIYCHILDPFTGYPVNSDLGSVTIVCADGMLADGLSTALYIMGLEKATEFWRQNSDRFEAFFIDGEGRLYATEGLKDSCSSVSGQSITILSR